MCFLFYLNKKWVQKGVNQSKKWVQKGVKNIKNTNQGVLIWLYNSSNSLLLI